MKIFSLLVASMWGIWLFYWLISAQGAKKSVGRKNLLEGTGSRLGIIVILFLLIRIPGVDNLLRSLNSTFTPLLQSIGVLLCFLGLAFTVWARVHLGKNWGMPRAVKENPELITSGPYQYVRHPIYSGVIVAMIGSSLVNGTVWFFVSLFLVMYFIYSIKPEEKYMLERFPKEYKAYKKKIKALLPFVY